MEKLSNILKYNKNKRVRDQYRLYEGYRLAVNADILKITSDISIRNRILYVKTKERAWVEQLIYFKQIILENINNYLPQIKEVRVTVDNDTLEEDEYAEELKKSSSHKCRRCETSLLSSQSKYCALCIIKEESMVRSKIFKVISDTPWIKYEQIEIEERKMYSRQRFYREKKYKINQIYDTIVQSYFEVKKGTQGTSLDFFKTKVEEYTIIKLSIEPEKLTDDIIKQNISSRFYKLYISK